MMKDFAIFTLYFSGIYFLCINIFYGLLMLFSWLKIRVYNQRERHLNLDRYRTGVSFIVPAFNEESLIVETIQTYLSLDYPRKEIIIINDGSKDQTFRLLQIMFQLRRTGADSTQFSSITYPELKVIQAEHRGKAHALNTGIMHASNEIICTMDADTIPTREGVEAALKAFEWDPGLMAVGGIIQVLNTHVLKDNSPLKHMPQSWPTKFQTIEYIRTFLCVRLGWSFIRSTSLISGAFCMLKKKAWGKVGGFKLIPSRKI
jgi:cellulose synthase/poly-beta-1,6-N-acetylglucosamine synthase-like glycosyltransferase